MKQHTRVFLVIGALLATGEPAWAFDGSFIPTELGSLSSVSAIDDGSALVVNPAAMTSLRGSELFASRSVNGLQQTNLFLTGSNFGTGFQQYNLANRFLNNFTLGAAAELAGGLSLGGNFHYLQFLDGQGSNSANFDLAAIYRPEDWLSGGFVLQNVTAPPIGLDTLKRNYRAGLAFRPFKDYVTLSIDGNWVEGDPVTNITPLVGLQLKPLPGVTLRGLVDNQLQYSLGLGFELGQLGTGLITGVSRGRVGPSDMAYMKTSTYSDRSALQLGFPHMAFMRLEGDLRDRPQNALDIRPELLPGVMALTERMAQAKADPKVDGLVLELRGVGTGLGNLQELRAAIADFKTSGKTTVAYIYSPGMGEYYLAAGCDKVYMHPSGTLDITGVSESVPFFRGILDKLGVRPQFVGIGKFKSAPEQYMRGSFTGPAEQEARELLDDQFDQMVEGIAASRRLSPAEVKTLVDRGMLTPVQAKEKNLIDGIAYPDQVPALMQKGVAETFPLRVYKPRTWAKPDAIAVVSVDGTISQGDSGGDLVNGTTVGSGSVTHALREIRKDESIKAVVLRVDSPGGDSLASDEIGRELDLLRLANKVVIVSMGNLAASGGYWVSANGTRIYAEPGTITGSIGVFTGSFAYKGLLDKLGITTQTVKHGAHADMDSGFRDLTDEEITMLHDQARYTYVQFIERVATGRKMTTSRVDEIAQGRVWAGSRAKDLGLVDRIGGLAAAVADAREQAKLDPTTSVIEFYPKPGALWEAFDDSNMEERLNRTVKAVQHYQRVQNWLLMPPIESQRK